MRIFLPSKPREPDEVGPVSVLVPPKGFGAHKEDARVQTWRKVSRVAEWVCVLGMVVMLVWSWGALSSWMRTRYPLPSGVESVQIGFMAWIPHGERRAMAELVSQTMGDDPLDVDAPSRTVLYLEQNHPSVAHVREVRRDPRTGMILVSLGWRVPVVLWESGGESVLLDATGRLVVRELDMATRARLRLPVLRGIDGVLEPGQQQVEGEALKQILETVAMLPSSVRAEVLEMCWRKDGNGVGKLWLVFEWDGRRVEIEFGSCGEAAVIHPRRRIKALLQLLVDWDVLREGTCFSVETGSPVRYADIPVDGAAVGAESGQ